MTLPHLLIPQCQQENPRPKSFKDNKAILLRPGVYDRFSRVSESRMSSSVILTTKYLMCYCFGQPLFRQRCNCPVDEHVTCNPIDQFTDMLLFGFSAFQTHTSLAILASFQVVIKATPSSPLIKVTTFVDNYIYWTVYFIYNGGNSWFVQLASIGSMHSW